MDIELVDRWDFLGSDDQFIVVKFNKEEQCELKKKRNFLYILKCQNGYEVYNTKDCNCIGYRNLTPNEHGQVIDYIREQIKAEQKIRR